ncbi:MAG: ClcB-like voltage-gated chloride channel protein [Steroidobacteraceae bacterium]
MPGRRARPATGLRWFTRARFALLGHEELAAILFWAAAVGFAGALASVAFREAIRLLHWLFTGQTGGFVQTAESLANWHRVAVPVVGGLLAGAVLQFGRRLVDARRAVDYMESVVVGDGAIAARPTLLKSLASLLSIASGGSIGREGPMVQLAALLGSKLGSVGAAPVPRRRLLVACGAAAGIAAAYNAPIAGALFVGEVVMGSIAMESFGPLLVAAVTANATVHHFLGYGPIFEIPVFTFTSNWELVLYALLGVLLGHAAPSFLALLDGAKRAFGRLPVSLSLRLGVGGLIVGLLSLRYPQVWGNGYSVVDDILHGNVVGWMLAGVLVAKLASTAATVGSGAVGGVFTPTLFVGAALGALVATAAQPLLPHVITATGGYALVGMGALLAATTHAPLMSILMIFEMTLDYQVVLPLILACVTAHYTAKVYRRGSSVYAEALHPPTPDATRDWRTRTVGQLLKPAAAVVTRDMTVREVLAHLPARPAENVYVIDADGQLVATLSPRTLVPRVRRDEVAAGAQVGDIATATGCSLTPDMSLTEALELFLRERVATLPVTSGQWHTRLLGEVSRHDLLLAIQERLSETRTASLE